MHQDVLQGYVICYTDSMQSKKLYRSKKNKMLAGICGGLGEYFDIDPTLIRVVWLLVVIFTGIFPGVVAYIIGIFVIPPAPDAMHVHHASAHEKTEGSQHRPDAE